MPGIGVISAKRIVASRRMVVLRLDGLKKLGVVLKRAQYFITCGGIGAAELRTKRSQVVQALLTDSEGRSVRRETALGEKQMSLFGEPEGLGAGEAREEAFLSCMRALS